VTSIARDFVARAGVEITPDDERDASTLMPLDEALELLQRIAGTRVATTPDAAERVCELVGCLPLALQIVGAALRIQPLRSVADYARALAEERKRLSQLRFAGDAALDVRASFSLSLRLLEPAEIDFFAGLSVCALDGFSLVAAAAANGCAALPAQERIACLFGLSLVNVVSPSRGTYCTR